MNVYTKASRTGRVQIPVCREVGCIAWCRCACLLDLADGFKMRALEGPLVFLNDPALRGVTVEHGEEFWRGEGKTILMRRRKQW